MIETTRVQLATLAINERETAMFERHLDKTGGDYMCIGLRGEESDKLYVVWWVGDNLTAAWGKWNDKGQPWNKLARAYRRRLRKEMEG